MPVELSVNRIWTKDYQLCYFWSNMCVSKVLELITI